MDTFSVGKGYFHPSVHKIVEEVRYAKEQEAEGILLTLCWTGSAFWAYMALEEGVM